MRCMVTGCDEHLDFFSNTEPDDDWRDRLAHHSKIAEEHLRAMETEAAIIADPRPDVNFTVTVHKGMLWVPHETLIEAGYRCLEDFQVVQIRGKFYELQGHIGRQLTHGIKGGAWWIEEINPEAFVIPDTPPEGGESNGEDQDSD